MKRLKLCLIIFVAVLIFGCGVKKDNFIVAENGKKQYKNKDGVLVKDEWAEINGDKYFFDLNGYLVTKQWVQDEYYVDENGKMQKDYWYDDGNGNQYYLDENGKYARDCIKNISGKDYAFDKSGIRVKNGVFIDAYVNKGYYIDGQGNIDKNTGYKNVGNTNCFVNELGDVIINEWKEDKGKWYYYGADGLMAKNSFVDNDFYVDGNGEMMCNKEISIGNDTYVFDAEGHGKIKEAKKINFNELYKKYFYYLTDAGEKKYIFSNVNVSGDGKMLEVKHNSVWESSVMSSISKMNTELGLPQSLVNKIKATKEIDGMKTEKYGKITVSWSTKEEYITGLKQWWTSHWICFEIE